MFQYTFIGWVWEGPAAHLHQVYVRDTPPDISLLGCFILLLFILIDIVRMLSVCRRHLSRLTTKPTKWYVRPAKTQISLGSRPVWSECLVRSVGS